MRVLVAGGTGLVGQPLVQALVARGDAVTVLGRSSAKIADIFGDAVSGSTLDALTEEAVRGFDAVVNLAGENVGANMRWSEATIREIEESRVKITSALASIIKASGANTRLLNASGISAYGYDEETAAVISDEDKPVPKACGNDALTQVTARWEQAALDNLPGGIRLFSCGSESCLRRVVGLWGRWSCHFALAWADA
jgi:NAD dependent epimerase/dehydratase family enzyme